MYRFKQLSNERCPLHLSLTPAECHGRRRHFDFARAVCAYGTNKFLVHFLDLSNDSQCKQKGDECSRSHDYEQPKRRNSVAHSLKTTLRFLADIVNENKPPLWTQLQRKRSDRQC